MRVSKLLSAIPTRPREGRFRLDLPERVSSIELIQVPGEFTRMSTEIKKQIELEIAHVLCSSTSSATRSSRLTNSTAELMN